MKTPTITMEICNLFDDDSFEIINTNLSVLSIINKPTFDSGYPKEISVTVRMNDNVFTTTAYYHGMIDECYMRNGRIIHTNKTHYHTYYFCDTENNVHYFKPIFHSA